MSLTRTVLSLTALATFAAGVHAGTPIYIAMRLLPGSADMVEQCTVAPCDSPTIVSTTPLFGRFVATPLMVGAVGRWHRLDHLRFSHQFISPGFFDIFGWGIHHEMSLGEAGLHSLGLNANIDSQEITFTSGQVPNGLNAFPHLNIDIHADFVGDTRRAIRIIAEPICPGDFDDGSGRGLPDGAVTIDDLLYYLNIFEAGSISADVVDAGDSGELDNAVTIDDLLTYLGFFESGC